MARAVVRVQPVRRPVTRWLTVAWLSPAVRASCRSDMPVASRQTIKCVPAS